LLEWDAFTGRDAVQMESLKEKAHIIPVSSQNIDMDVRLINEVIINAMKSFKLHKSSSTDPFF